MRFPCPELFKFRSSKTISNLFLGNLKWREDFVHCGCRYELPQWPDYQLVDLRCRRSWRGEVWCRGMTFLDFFELWTCVKREKGLMSSWRLMLVHIWTAFIDIYQGLQYILYHKKKRTSHFRFNLWHTASVIYFFVRQHQYKYKYFQQHHHGGGYVKTLTFPSHRLSNSKFDIG